MRQRLLLVLVPVIAVLLHGCSSAPQGRYQLAQDQYPDAPPSVAHVEDAVPRYEPLSRGGNMPTYTVLGKQYQVMPSAKGFTEEGIASWYGKKFHGHKTSNGEIYDMYSMTAAHKSLPLPTFVRVTNLENNRSVVVRVNDRGPFHDDRIIDLSYTAAAKLDYLKSGTARVRVEAITVEPPAETADAGQGERGQFFIQLVASSQQAKLQQRQQQLQQPSEIHQEDGIYKLRLGPYPDAARADLALVEVRAQLEPTAFKVLVAQ